MGGVFGVSLGGGWCGSGCEIVWKDVSVCGWFGVCEWMWVWLVWWVWLVRVDVVGCGWLWKGVGGFGFECGYFCGVWVVVCVCGCECG